MRTYSSFLIRCWLIKDESRETRFVFDVEHIQTGKRIRAPSLAEAQAWMLTTLLPRAESRLDAADEGQQSPGSSGGADANR